MPIFEAAIQHDEKTFEQLAHMQYDLFCKSNRVGRTVLSIAAILLGIANSESWWGILAIGYGCYLTTSTYSSSNHTAHKLAKQIRAAGMDFPASRYVFDDDGMHVFTLPENQAFGEPLAYHDFCQLGEDYGYFYIFRDQYGGYMIPKSELEERTEAFRKYIERMTGLRFRMRTAPIIKLMRKLMYRDNEPYHL